MSERQAEVLQVSAIVTLIVLLTLAAFFGIYEMVKQGVVPQVLGAVRMNNA
jgi:hypothetical protein